LNYDSNGNPVYRTVPVRYGDNSRQVQNIIQDNSANSIISVPLISFYVTELQYARDRVQEPNFVKRVDVRQRKYVPETDTYETTQGNAFTVYRPMPVPYNLSIAVDIWTSSTTQKLQLIEQLCTLFNPSLEIQSTENFLDWTSLSVVELKGTKWSSRTVPTSTDNPIDVATFNFEMPIWISPPAKVTKMGVVHKIIANINDANGDADLAALDNDILNGTRVIITPHGYKILLLNNQLQIFPHSTVDTSVNTYNAISLNSENSLVWKPILAEYGVIRNGISKIYLTYGEQEISGTISFNPIDDRFLLFNLNTDTIPQNTLRPVNSVIDPLKGYPGNGLPTAVLGQRYLLTDDIGSDIDSEYAEGWAGLNGEELIAKQHDIIEYDGTQWIVVFDSDSADMIEYVTNLTTKLQYRWDIIDRKWVRSYEGLYDGGDWRIMI
jgi:hypothetical protein